MYKATINTMVKLAQGIRDTNVSMNPHQEALSEIQKAKSRTCYVDFDIDFPDGYDQHMGIVKGNIKKHVNEDAVTLLQTRGGLHCLVAPDKVSPEFKSKFYQGLKSIADVDQTGDQLIPVPGCTQGDFIPHFINF
jgi:hypothetical protein